MGTVVIFGRTLNVYGTFTGANDYLMTSRRFGASWRALSEEDQQGILVDVARNLNLRGWKGEKTSPAQALAWPRTGATDENGDDIASSVTPDQIVEASYVFAGLLALRPGALGQGSPTPALMSLREGPVSASFYAPGPNPTADASGLPTLAEVDAMIVGYLGEAGGASYGDLLAGMASGTDGESSFDDDKRYVIQDGLS
jgi:hypothetical protein